MAPIFRLKKFTTCQIKLNGSYRHVLEVKLCLLVKLLLLNAPERAIHGGLPHHGLSFVGLVDDPLHGGDLGFTTLNLNCNFLPDTHKFYPSQIVCGRKILNLSRPWSHGQECPQLDK